MQARFITTIIGKAGSGKTDLTRYIMERCPQPHMVIDTQDEFSFGLQFDHAADLWRHIGDGRPNASGTYVLNATTDEDAAEFFRLLAVARQPSTCIVDEASLFCSPSSIDENLNQLIQYGRHWRQHLIVNARRPAEISRHVTAQSDALISFVQTEPRDIQTLRKVYDDAERLSELEEHEFLVFGRPETLPFFRALLDRETARGTPAWQLAPGRDAQAGDAGPGRAPTTPQPTHGD